MTDAPVSLVRLFTALEVPETVRDTLAALPRKGPEARWTHPDDYHITLRFLGDVDPVRLPDIEDALSRVRRPRFGVELRGLDVFENRRETILYAAVQSTRKMEALCADISDALAPLGFDFGTRPFVPHVTLARLRHKAGLETYRARNDFAVAASWPAASFCLMRSAAPDEAGQRYVTLRKWDLSL